MPPPLVPKGRLDGLRVLAIDQDWSFGSGSEVRGRPARLVAMSLTGRITALSDLTGPAANILAARLSSQ